MMNLHPTDGKKLKGGMFMTSVIRVVCKVICWPFRAFLYIEGFIMCILHLIDEIIKLIIEWGTEHRFKAVTIGNYPNLEQVSSFRVLPEKLRPAEKREIDYPKKYLWEK